MDVWSKVGSLTQFRGCLESSKWVHGTTCSLERQSIKLGIRSNVW